MIDSMSVNEWAMHMCGWMKLSKVSLASFIVACKGDKCGQSELCILSSKLFWPSGSYTITWSSCKLLQITRPSNISAVLTEECARKIVDSGFE